MYKLVVFAALLAVAAAAPSPLGEDVHLGVASPYGAPVASVWGHGFAPAHIIKTAVPVATSYANTVRLASPYAAVAHAPVLASPYAHGF
ncbi:uncharacterized protein LOC125231603 [Leguminivora glycinivorella]|uniref:uncharacterized protein LOC125231603 n=1 Tax=Leguminivora glycinivorella TaxID=1035111 RepID=UPI00200D25BB|nr:uncharacterized protein LOC125231603 [Leguminivora glycinivorella]